MAPDIIDEDRTWLRRDAPTYPMEPLSQRFRRDYVMTSTRSGLASRPLTGMTATGFRGEPSHRSRSVPRHYRYQNPTYKPVRPVSSRRQRACVILAILVSFVLAIVVLPIINYHAILDMESKSNVHTKLEQYPYPPVWMYDNPVQVIGMPSPAAPEFIPPLHQIEAAAREQKIRWHPDKYARNRFESIDDADIAHKRIIDALQVLKRYYKNPYCNETQINIAEFDKFAGYDKAPGLPRFAPNCSCTMQSLLYKIATPFFSYTAPGDDFESYCPCNWTMALQNYRSFIGDSVYPPIIPRIKRQIPLTTLHHKSFWYNLQALSQDDELDVGDSNQFKSYAHAVLCAAGRLDGCAKMANWTSPMDHLPRHQSCYGWYFHVWKNPFNEDNITYILDEWRPADAENGIRRSTYEDEMRSWLSLCVDQDKFMYPIGETPEQYQIEVGMSK